MRRSPLVISPAKRDAMRHMLLAGVRPRDLTSIMHVTPQQVAIRPRRRSSAEVRT